MKSRNHNYRAKFLLMGFNSEVDTIQLDDSIVIRKGKEDELKEMYDRIRKNNAETQQYFLEFEYVSDNHSGLANEAYHLMDELNSFFLIFTHGHTKTAHFLRYCLIENEYKSVGFNANNKVSTYYIEEFLVTSESSKKIIKDWNSFILQRDKKAFQIGIRRLLFSTQKYEPEDQLIDLMIAFEAIYLDASEKGEISYKLALRSSYFLRNEYNRLQVFEFMKKAYSLRSSIVHGANLKGNTITFKEKKLDLESVVDEITNLLRSTFEIIICEHANSSTKEIIESIDTGINTGGK
jgi:hypothetical protein